MIDPQSGVEDQLAEVARVLEATGAESDGAVAARVTLDVEYRAAQDVGSAPAQHVSVELPRAAVAALLEIARALAQGSPVQIVPHGTMLTTQQAAEILDVSRPHVIALVERGELSCEWAGRHRRLRSTDVLAYRERRGEARRAAARAVQIASAEVEGGY